MSENDNENVFFSLDESDQSDDSNEIPNFLDDFNFTNEINDLNNEGIVEVMFVDYKLNYTVKELLLICEYYGIAKQLKIQEEQDKADFSKESKNQIPKFKKIKEGEVFNDIQAVDYTLVVKNNINRKPNTSISVEYSFDEISKCFQPPQFS